MSKKMRMFLFLLLIWTCSPMNIFDMPVGVAEAGEHEMKYIVPKLAGNWRNRAGNVVVSIDNGYLNGCRILDCYAPAGGGGFGSVMLRIEESAGIRDLQIVFMIFNYKSDYIELVNGGNNQRLYKYMDYYKESIAGVHLGSTRDEVEKLWGRGEKGNYPYLDEDGFLHREKGVILYYYHDSADNVDIVERIILLKSSPLSFYITGINAKNIPRDLAGKWVRPVAGYAEYFWYGENREYVQLNRCPF